MKTKTAQHTPTPWNHRPKYLQNPIRYLTVDDNGFDRIVGHILPTHKDDAFANAAFIVRAVNAHEELLALTKEFHDRLVISGLGHTPDCECPITKAIAKAEGKGETHDFE